MVIWARESEFSPNLDDDVTQTWGVDTMGDLGVSAGGLTKLLTDSLRISTKACCGLGWPTGAFIALWAMEAVVAGDGLRYSSCSAERERMHAR